jgi:cyclophilin family peptidyl-prolyl cis-trans isomerase/HEAT repeat protein
MRILTKISAFSIFLLLGIISCLPPEYNKKKYIGVSIDLNDPVVKQIFDIKDKQSQDSLFRFLRKDNPTYRYLAALSFGSFKEIINIDTFSSFLYDSDPDVRIAVAYAIGQTGNIQGEKYLKKAFLQTDTFPKANAINEAIMEAIGKCGSALSLQQIAINNTYKSTDTSNLMGQSLAIYRFGIRNIVSIDGTNRMISYAENDSFPDKVRNLASNYLMRVKNITFDSSQTNRIYNTLKNDKNVNVRIALAKAIGKTLDNDICPRLLNIYESEKDYRVLCNIISGISKLPINKTHDIIVRGLRSKNSHISITASNYCLENGNSDFAKEILNIAKDTTRFWRSRLTMLEAANKWLKRFDKSKDSLNTALVNSYSNSTNPYEKAALLNTLSQHLNQFKFIWENGINDENPVVKTAAVEALGKIVRSPNFGKYFGSNYGYYKKEIRLLLFDAINTKDVGVIATAAGILRDPESEFNIYMMKDSIPSLQATLSALKLPSEIETYNELLHLIHYINEDEKGFVPKKPDFNRPIDWSLLFNDKGSNIATVTTDKGDFDIQLIPEIAPGSVINFKKLIRDNFFSNKYFHRVVPNFVAQTGCNRGDGYGALSYSIRTDLSNYHYDDEGWVGMASAGLNTEGTQWFVTHSPAWHLDPNYTIFGKVTRGMQIVHELEQGDKILRITIK